MVYCGVGRPLAAMVCVDARCYDGCCFVARGHEKADGCECARWGVKGRRRIWKNGGRE
jgi:hypothetical protein